MLIWYKYYPVNGQFIACGSCRRKQHFMNSFRMYSALVFIVCAALCGGMLMVLYQRNAELMEIVKSNEDKLRELEKSLNPAEHDTMVRSRLSNTEVRVTALEKLIKSHTVDLDMVGKQVRSVLSGGGGAVSKDATVSQGNANSEQVQVLTNQIIFVNDRVNGVVARVDALVNAQNALATRALMMENTNMCILSSTDTCPPKMTKSATFGIIAHTGQNPIPPGYYPGGQFAEVDNGWNWLHGGLCCMNIQ